MAKTRVGASPRALLFRIGVRIYNRPGKRVLREHILIIVLFCLLRASSAVVGRLLFTIWWTSFPRTGCRCSFRETECIKMKGNYSIKLSLSIHEIGSQSPWHEAIFPDGFCLHVGFVGWNVPWRMLRVTHTDPAAAVWSLDTSSSHSNAEIYDAFKSKWRMFIHRKLLRRVGRVFTEG